MEATPWKDSETILHVFTQELFLGPYSVSTVYYFVSGSFQHFQKYLFLHVAKKSSFISTLQPEVVLRDFIWNTKISSCIAYDSHKKPKKLRPLLKQPNLHKTFQTFLHLLIYNYLEGYEEKIMFITIPLPNFKMKDSQFSSLLSDTPIASYFSSASRRVFSPYLTGKNQSLASHYILLFGHL